MAEALLRNKASDMFDVFSAGTAPSGIDERTLDAISRFGLSTEGLSSKSVDAFAGQHFDLVITLCDKARQECGSFPNHDELIAWDFEDPKTRAGAKAFDVTMQELNARVNMLVLLKNKA
jgi:ArsR family transcriptional regulator